MIGFDVQRAFRGRLEASARRYGITDMKRFRKVLESVPTEVMNRLLREDAERLADAVISEIQAQPSNWPPLNPDYLAHKLAVGLSPEMLKATEDYVGSIGVQRIYKGKTRVRIYVGVPNLDHRTAKMNYNDLGRIHEFGTRKIPARPHWGPAYWKWKASIPHFIHRMSSQIGNRTYLKLLALVKKPEQGRVIKMK